MAREMPDDYKCNYPQMIDISKKRGSANPPSSAKCDVHHRLQRLIDAMGNCRRIDLACSSREEIYGWICPRRATVAPPPERAARTSCDATAPR
eukprot:6198979-Pleurochrysis_carterae.AAC.2